MVAQSTARIPTRTRTVRVPHMAASVPRMRRTIVQDLRSRDVPTDVVEEAEMVVSELLGNSVRHASPLADGTVRIHWQVKGGVVALDVTDGGGAGSPDAPAGGGAPPQKPLQPSVYSVSGRGLRIVRSLAHEWGVLDE